MYLQEILMHHLDQGHPVLNRFDHISNITEAYTPLHRRATRSCPEWKIYHFTRLYSTAAGCTQCVCYLFSGET